jgi:hypothetical protein
MKIFLKKRLAIRIYLGLTLSEDIVGGCMSKLFSIFICFLFIIMSLPAYADWCRVQGGGAWTSGSNGNPASAPGQHVNGVGGTGGAGGIGTIWIMDI